MNLTSEQSTVVNLASGRHLVLAPPGSGKTEMLSQHIIRALGSQMPPDKMLCATFTNRTAFEMRERINETYLHVVSHSIPEEKRYRWIQIDEVQDLNPLQWRIVRELTAPEAVSVYFGDVKQSIFSTLIPDFQG